MLSEAATKDPAMSGQLTYERADGDFYPTPPENVDCLAHFINLRERFVWEPACGEGHISKRLEDLCVHVISTDLFHRGFGHGGVDFLKVASAGQNADAIITNPPFGGMAEQFIRHALGLMEDRKGLVAMFLRNEYDMASTGRNDLFEDHPAFAMKVCVTKRPRWIAGSTGSPRHNYAWYVWDWKKVDGHPSICYIHPKNARPL